MYNPAAADMLNYQKTAAMPLEQKKTNALASPVYKELSSHQLRILLKASNLKGKQLISLLLSGLSFDEAVSLKASQIDLEMATITVHGSMPRTLGISNSLKALFAQSGDHPAWDADNPIASDDLTASLLCAAVDSGLPSPEEITSEAIRHSYIVYLVRQGLRLSDLEKIIGYLEPPVISSYSAYSPPQQGRAIDDIELLHPALVDVA
jgi:site-specific recombinase XerD